VAAVQRHISPHELKNLLHNQQHVCMQSAGCGSTCQLCPDHTLAQFVTASVWTVVTNMRSRGQPTGGDPQVWGLGGANKSVP
jgi:hypothetical protein